jgi:hypothetical protein
MTAIQEAERGALFANVCRREAHGDALVHEG